MRKIKVVVLFVWQLQHGFTKNAKVSLNLTVAHFWFRILTFDICSSEIRPVIKQACPSENIILHLFMSRSINISLT